VPAVGDTMMIPGDNGVPHLFVIIWGPGDIPPHDTDVFMLACFDTIKPNLPHDPACELKVGDHRFITDPTYVNYRKIRCDKGNHIDAQVASGVWPPRTPASQPLLFAMRTGICSSLLAKPKYQYALGC
jgi:hypothetical protein